MVAPLALIFGVVDLYSKTRFFLDYETYAPQCLSEYEGGEADILSIEYEAAAVFVKFQKRGSSETFWCENDDGAIRIF